MKNIPEHAHIEQLNTNYCALKKAFSGRELLLEKRQELEKQIDKVGNLSLSPEKEEQKKTLKKALLKLDHQLDITEGLTQEIFKEMRSELLQALLRNAPDAAAQIEAWQTEELKLLEKKEKLNASFEQIDQVYKMLCEVLTTLEHNKSRSFFHYLFGKSPYLLMQKRLDQLKKQCETMETDTLFQQIVNACTTQWTMKQLEQTFLPFEKQLTQALGEIKKLQGQTTQELYTLQQQIDDWIESRSTR